MKTFKHLAAFIASVTLLSACQEEINLELPDNEPDLVVEGYLVDLDFILPEGDLDCSGVVTIPLEEIQFAAAIASQFPIDSIEKEADIFPFNKVKLSTTTDYFSEDTAPVVSNAQVRLYKDGELVEELLEDANEPGTYRITHDPEVGAVYYLEIEALDNFYTTEPETYMAVPPLLAVNAIYRENFIGDSMFYYMGIQTYEKQGEGDYYRWFFYENNKLRTRPTLISTTNDEGLDGLCLFDFDVYGNELNLGDTLVVFQMKTSENYFNFVNSIRSQTAFVGSPFDAPPAPIVGNVKNETTGRNAQGFFHASGISANAVVVPDTIPAQ